MHSSRMRTTRCSSHLGRRVVCPGGCLPGRGCVSDQVWGCTPPAPLPWREFLTHACKNITFPELRLRTVTRKKSTTRRQAGSQQEPILLSDVAYLPPATKLGQGYIFTGVCDSVHGGGLLLGGVCAWSRWGGLLPGGVPGPGGVGAWSQWGVCSWGVPGGDPPGTATAAGGTHPTRMLSCSANLRLTSVTVISLFTEPTFSGGRTAVKQVRLKCEAHF